MRVSFRRFCGLFIASLEAICICAFPDFTQEVAVKGLSPIHPAALA